MLTSSRIAEHPSALFTTGLPILQVALNPSVMTKNFEAFLTAGNGWSPREVSHANLVAYKQGNRGLIRYDLSGGSEPDEVVLGKLYPDPGRAARVDDIMRWLWGEVFSNAGPLTVPQPLGCVPELAMLVFKPLAGQPLDSALSQRADVSTIELCARWLAALHGSSTALDRRFDLAVEVVNLEAWAALIAHRYPGFESASYDLFRALRQRSKDLALEWSSPIHKDFHYQHIFVGRSLGVIDFDEVRLGDRNFDVAHFCAHLHLLASRTPEITPETAAALQDHFLSAYERFAGWTQDQRLPFFLAYTCLKIGKQLSTTRGVRPRPEGDEELRQLRIMLSAGIDALEGRAPR
jgi:hypothetical protein